VPRSLRLALATAAGLTAMLVAAGPATADGVRAQLPRTFLDTDYSPPTGNIIRVHAGEDLQVALDAAQPGDQVTLTPGATYTGNFVLPKKAGGEPIVVRPRRLIGMPEGERVTPQDADAMARIQTPNSDGAVRTAPGAHDWRFVGIEFGIVPGTPTNFGVVQLGTGDETRARDLPTDIVVDRCWVHGNATGNARRGVALNGGRQAVVDSYVSNFHEVGADSQAIAGWNGPGPFKIVNNYIEGAGENLMFGGADPSVQGIVPSDIEIRGNHFRKPLRWRVGDPSYAGIHWTVKNLFELKSARRVLVEGNVLENNWGDAQTGYAVLLKSANQDGRAPWSEMVDVTFRNNLVRHAGAALSVVGRDPHTQGLSKRVTIENNVFEDIDHRRWRGPGIFLLVTSSPPPPGGTPAGPQDLVVEHNTAFHTGSTVVADGPPSRGFVFNNNIVANNTFGVKGSGSSTGIPTLQQFFPGYRFLRNALVGGKASLYPPDNFFPPTYAAVGFTDLAGGDYRLAPDSPLAGMGQGGTDVGADINALEAAIDGS
jgi:Right handed beta helix region